MLNDMARPYTRLSERGFATCGSDGHFSFSYFKSNDGYPIGKYVVTIAQLKSDASGRFLGPDRLKNLYNDPDVNKGKTQFVLVHAAPGRTDYHFNLSFKDVRPVTKPGPRALIEIDKP